MRSARIRYDRELCYYHLLNRVAGERNFFPFGDVEKEQFFRLVLELSRLYAVELLSLVVMSNHYHIVCAAPAEAPALGCGEISPPSDGAFHAPAPHSVRKAKAVIAHRTPKRAEARTALPFPGSAGPRGSIPSIARRE